MLIVYVTQDGSGEAYVSEVEARRSASNFSMFPPVESSPRVFIEPLPDISKLRPNPSCAARKSTATAATYWSGH
jgi:hypothetical protein